MSAAPALDLDNLRRWIGRTQTTSDTISPRLLEQFATVFGETAGDHAPSGIHWCLAPAAAPAGSLGDDGHPVRGGFLPPVPLPRRMWAASAVEFVAPLKPGDEITRVSRVANVNAKRGRSGDLCFVTVEHDLATPRGIAIRERQDLVFRAPADTTPASTIDPDFAATAQPAASPVTLFRYSALTFNGHRIHYDRDYARDVEGYPGLVVQGPLQATWLLQLAMTTRGHHPRHFAFRGIRPLTDLDPYRLSSEAAGDLLKLWVQSATGPTMEATAQW